LYHLIEAEAVGQYRMVEKDGMETGIAQELLDAGVPKEDVVFGFYRPERRTITEFAMA
jgi:hypothetical protein